MRAESKITYPDSARSIRFLESRISLQACSITARYPMIDSSVRDPVPVPRSTRKCGKGQTYCLGLRVQYLRAQLRSFRSVDERLITNRAALAGRRGGPMPIRRYIHYSNMLIARSLCRSNKSGEKELSEMEVAEHVSPKLHVVAMCRQRVYRGPHYSG